ncbi:host specificity protein J [Acinetobacter tibetensis]|uniref:Phage tail protein n=1 Tax=Acinetobacter tibetensis TaxID=2943497 RepID=A0AAE9LTS7_9GAMM|nr:phage tail protein [Acinetobacter tibetensis]USE84355.1 phage tail protein [Acinetobacter tibetensis]
MNRVVQGAKAGSGEARKSVIATDSAQSKTFIKILYGLSEGPIKGLVDGIRSIYLDDTPLQDANGIWNFENVTVDSRLGTNDQTYIEGFPDISSETGIGVELKSSAAWVKSFTNLELDALHIRLRWGPLRQQNIDNGDVSGITILYAIDLQTDGGAWTEVLNTKISDKTSANYERSHRIDLPKANFGWQVRVRRITPNSSSESVSDKMYVQAITEVIDAKLRYPNTALLGLQYDAETFSNVAKMAAECEGVEILLPSNYNPVSREYTGLWDGTFKRAYSNNPAWHFYDVCVSKRYALGDRINSSMIDKWSIYRLGQYCDQLVPDGKGGQEPRFTLNVYEQSQDDAWSVLSKMAGAFRAYIYWDGQAIVCDADIPQDTYFTYTAANVIDGHFEYSGTRARDRHTVAKVAWDNPNNRYKTEYVFVRDEAAIARLGIRIAEIAAYGCTSEAQAQRAGHWALKSEQYETRTVTFKVGLDGFIPRPGKVIEIADPLFAGRANGGRIAAVSADLKKITLDRDDVICRAGDRLVVNGENGKAQARIVQSMTGRVITVVSAFESVAAQNVWVVDAQDLATMKFRVISITQDDTHQFTINALQYNASKYDAIDNGAFIDERPISIINPRLQNPVASVTISSEQMVQQGLTVATMIITWPQVEGATKYQVEWRKDDGSWLKLPITGNNSVEVQGIYTGNYQARVVAINAFDIASLATYSTLTALKGKQGNPPKLAFITATGILFGMHLKWGFPAVGALDTAYTEIQVSPDGISNIAQLGLFSYPTTTHTIQGLQPNLTQFYRGRLIDRIGNIGDWSDWTNATTSADASAVLDILSGKITESQLHQDLQTKIDRIDTVEGDIADIIQAVNNVEDGVTQERTERISGDQDVLNQLTIYKVSNNQAVAAVVEEVDTLADQQVIMSSKIDGVYAQVNPSLIGDDSMLIGSTAGYAGVWSEQSARIEEDIAQSLRTDSVIAQMAANDAIYQSQIQANASAIAANVSATTILQTTVGQNTASIQTQQQSINGINLQYTLKLDSNGYVAGMGVMNDGKTSNFIINSDMFALGNPAGSVGTTYPFIFRTTPYTDPLTGTVFPVSAYMKSAMFDYQSVKTSHIEDLAVKTAKIDALAVTTAKIDNLAVTEGKIANLAVDTLKIKDNAVTVPVSAFAEAATTVGTDYITIQTLAVPSDMGHTILTFGAVFSFTSYTSQQRLLCRVLKNGNVVFEDLEVHFVDYDSVGVTSDNSGQHQHSVSVTVNGSANDAGNHSHSFSGSTGNSSAGSVANSFHSHNYNGSTNSGGSHGHNLSLNANASMGLDGIHSHNITIRGSARSAGTLNISRHDSTGIAGTFQLQLKSGSGGNVSVSQRYIHAMTMRK